MKFNFIWRNSKQISKKINVTNQSQYIDNHKSQNNIFYVDFYKFDTNH